jgi:hypothetical protein
MSVQYDVMATRLERPKALVQLLNGVPQAGMQQHLDACRPRIVAMLRVSSRALSKSSEIGRLVIDVAVYAD